MIYSNYADNVRWVVRNFGGQLFRDYGSSEELRAVLIFAVMRTIDRARLAEMSIQLPQVIPWKYDDLKPSAECVAKVRQLRANGAGGSDELYETLGAEVYRLLASLVTTQ